jgi:acetylornithine deacetylase
VWKIDEAAAKALLLDLVAIDSVNPSLIPGGAGEEKVAARIAEYARSSGFLARLDYVTPTRPNVIAISGGPVSGDAAFGLRHGLLLNGHTDVVDVLGMTDPFTPRVQGDRIYGRGAGDMKGGLVAGLMAIKAVRDAGVTLKKSIVFTGVVDEEYASIGTEDVARRYDAEAAVVLDGGFAPEVAHKGFSWVTLETFGKASHGSRYLEGIDAIAMMSRLLTRVDELNAQYQRETPHPLCGHKSIHASLIEGGKGLSTYPDYCKARLERRALPTEDPGLIVEELSSLVKGLTTQDPRFSAKVTLDFARHGYEIDPAHPLVSTLTQAIRRQTGREAALVGAGGWKDSAILGAKGIPTVIFGTGGHGAHSVEEWVELPTVVSCARVLADVIVAVCGE